MISICDDLRKSVLQAAIQGRLTQQLPEDGDAEDLYKQIQVEKQRLIKEGKIKKEKPLPEIKDDDIPFDIPENWKWAYLGDIFSHNAGKALNQSNAEGTLLTYITTSNLYWEGFVLDNLRSMKFTESEMDKCTIRKGDLLVCEGGDIGRSAIWPYDYEMRIQNHIHKLRTYIDICTKYYWHVLYLYKLSGLIGGKGIGIQGLSSNALHKLILPLPPLAEQKRIVARVDELMKRIDEMEKTEKDITALYDAFPDDMKAALLQAAIQGKLTEQLDSDGDAEALYQAIQAEKQRLIKEGKIKKEKPLPEIKDDDIPFDIPENWKWVHLHDVIYHVGSKSNQILAKDIKSEGRYPVISQGANFIDGYCNENLLVHEYPVIMFGDHTKNVKYIDFPFVIGADGTKFLKAILIDSRYLFYWTLFTASQLHDRGYARHYTLLAQTLFPLPPLAEQKRIVEKLDQLLPLCNSMKEAIDATA